MRKRLKIHYSILPCLLLTFLFYFSTAMEPLLVQAAPEVNQPYPMKEGTASYICQFRTVNPASRFDSGKDGSYGYLLPDNKGGTAKAESMGGFTVHYTITNKNGKTQEKTKTYDDIEAEFMFYSNRSAEQGSMQSIDGLDTLVFTLPREAGASISINSISIRARSWQIDSIRIEELKSISLGTPGYCGDASSYSRSFKTLSYFEKPYASASDPNAYLKDHGFAWTGNAAPHDSSGDGTLENYPLVKCKYDDTKFVPILPVKEYALEINTHALSAKTTQDLSIKINTKGNYIYPKISVYIQSLFAAYQSSYPLAAPGGPESLENWLLTNNTRLIIRFTCEELQGEIESIEITNNGSSSWIPQNFKLIDLSKATYSTVYPNGEEAPSVQSVLSPSFLPPIEGGVHASMDIQNAHMICDFNYSSDLNVQISANTTVTFAKSSSRYPLNLNTNSSSNYNMTYNPKTCLIQTADRDSTAGMKGLDDSPPESLTLELLYTTTEGYQLKETIYLLQGINRYYLKLDRNSIFGITEAIEATNKSAGRMAFLDCLQFMLPSDCASLDQIGIRGDSFAASWKWDYIAFYDKLDSDGHSYQKAYGNHGIKPEGNSSSFICGVQLDHDITVPSNGTVTYNLIKDGSSINFDRINDYSDEYIVTVSTTKNRQITFPASQDLLLSFTYIDSTGTARTSEQSVRKQTENYLGKKPDWILQSGTDTTFRIKLVDVKYFVNATLTIQDSSGADRWQMSGLTIQSIKELELPDNQNMTRKFVPDKTFAVYELPLLFSPSGSMQRTISLTDQTGGAPVVDVPGTSNDNVPNDALIKINPDITFEEINKNLYLTSIKSTYNVAVKVSNVQDAGSTNYFFFQLVFENGSSGIVLANEQIAGDAFVQNTTHTFTIHTNQNYGKLKSIRIYCHASSDGNSSQFDKLCLDQVLITKRSKSAASISPTWKVTNIGWIDMPYADAEVDEITDLESLDSERSSDISSQSVMKEFLVTNTSTSVNLVFSISTSNEPDSDTLGNITAKLSYINNNGSWADLTIPLNPEIKSYSDQNAEPFRLGRTDRFLVNLSDVQTLKTITLTTDSEDSFKCSAIAVYLSSTLGETYLSTDGEWRKVGDDKLTLVTKANVTNMILQTGTNAKGYASSVNWSFDESTKLDFSSYDVDAFIKDDDYVFDTGSSNITSANESLNLYLYPGNVGKKSDVSYVLKYSTAYGTYMQTAGTFRTNKTLPDGAFYVENVKLTNAAELLNLTISSEGTPSISHIVVERISDGNVKEVHDVNFYGQTLFFPLKAGMNANSLADTGSQTILFYPDSDIARLSDSLDILVSFAYKSSFHLNGTTLHSPYRSLTDSEIFAMRKGEPVSLTFNQPYVGKIEGISIRCQSSDAKNLTEASYFGVFAANYDENGTFLSAATDYKKRTIGSGYGYTPLLASGLDSNSLYPELYQDVFTPVTFYVTTDSAADSGTGSDIEAQLVVQSLTDPDETNIIQLGSLMSYVPYSQRDGAFAAGSTTTLNLPLFDTAAILELHLKTGSYDPWKISSFRVSRQLANGMKAEAASAPLDPVTNEGYTKIDLRTADMKLTPDEEIFGKYKQQLEPEWTVTDTQTPMQQEISISLPNDGTGYTELNEAQDIGVSLRYKATGKNGTWQTRYYSLRRLGVTGYSTGDMIHFKLNLPNVAEIKGISLITSKGGTSLITDQVYIKNTGSSGTLLYASYGTAEQVNSAQEMGTYVSVLKNSGTGGAVTPLDITFKTSASAGAGTLDPLQAVLTFADPNNAELVKTLIIPDLRSYVSMQNEESFAEGSATTVSLLVYDMGTLLDLSLLVNGSDQWQLESVSAKRRLSDDSLEQGSGLPSVSSYGWIGGTIAETINVRPGYMRDEQAEALQRQKELDALNQPPQTDLPAETPESPDETPAPAEETLIPAEEAPDNSEEKLN